MAVEPLPPELAAVERELSERRRTEPPGDLRPRVLGAVRRELRRRFWSRTALAAAAVLLWLNLSMIATSNTSWALETTDPGRVEETAGRIRALAPELPEREVYRQALLAQH